MENSLTPVPVVLSINLMDPTGGSGLQADGEAITSMGCHIAPIVSCITSQDTQSVREVSPIDSASLISQVRVILEDMPVSVIKIGYLATPENVEVIHTILNDYPNIPIVFDPKFRFLPEPISQHEKYILSLITLLLPQVTICVLNDMEIRILGPEGDSPDSCAQELMEIGVEYILRTGQHSPKAHIENSFYGSLRKLETFQWKRINQEFLGAGCTLSASIAGLLAQGHDPLYAAHEGQEYTNGTLANGYRIGMGKKIPNRFFWARNEPNTKEPT